MEEGVGGPGEKGTEGPGARASQCRPVSQVVRSSVRVNGGPPADAEDGGLEAF